RRARRRVCRGVYRDAADDLGVRLLEARLQMTLRPAATVGIAAALLATVVEVQAARERWYPPPADEQASLYLQSGVAVRRLAGAYAPLAADLYWIRAVQYYGGTKHRLNPDPVAADGTGDGKS